MGVSEHVKYYNAITRLEAQEALIALSIAEYPHIQKPSDRKKRHKEFKKLAYPEPHSKRGPLSLEAVTSILNKNSSKVKNG